MMASDFYRRTNDLFEEFKKRELAYSNTERMSYQFQTTDNSSLPIQEYLQKLNKREKETEDTYRGLINHMEDLERRTENISAKLEKLNSLKTYMISKPSWSSSIETFDKPYFSYNYPSSAVQNTPDFKHTLSSPLQTFSSQNRDIKFASTQTNCIFCENCHFPVTLLAGISNTAVASPTIATTIESIPPVPQNTSLNSRANENAVISNQSADSALQNSEVVDLHKNKAQKNVSAVTEDSILLDKRSYDQAEVAIPEENPFVSSALIKEKPIAADVRGTEAILTTADENDFTNLRYQSTEDITSVSDNVDRIASKSDDESLNHEFDFLESDKRNQRRKLHAEKMSQSDAARDRVNSIPASKVAVASDELNIHVSKETVHDPVHIQRSAEEMAENAKINLETVPKSTNETDDKRSESSISIGGARSPSLRSENMSAISDSDSLYEKETPHLKASAAYQALLGNVSAAKSVQKPVYSESESEDEVERALANVTRKTSNVPVTSTNQDHKAQDEKKIIPENKTKNEPRKSISMSKPTQLSKNTRKVLGLETSSGSDGEVQIQATAKKKVEEESDEFDFFD